MSLIQKRFLGLILFVLAGFGGLALFSWQDKTSKEQQATKLSDGRLFAALDIEAIVALRFNNKKGEVRLVRQDSGDDWVWKVIKPVQSDADTTAVMGILTHLSRAKILAYVGESKPNSDGEKEIIPPDDLKLYGLDTPRYELEITKLDGSSETLLGGAINSFNGNLFVKLKERQSVMSVSGNIEYQLDKGVHDLRERRLISFDSKAVVGVEVESFDKLLYALAKDEETTLYNLSHPIKMRANAEQVSTILTALGNLQAKEFISDTEGSPPVIKYGLDKPKFRATLKFGDGTSLVILYSALGKGGDEKEYAMVEGSSRIARLNAYGLLGRIVFAPSLLADTKVMGFSRDLISFVELHSDAARITLSAKVRGDGSRDWWMDAPSIADLRDSQVEGLLYKLEVLRQVTVSDIHSDENPLTDKILDARGVGDKAPTIKLLAADKTLLSALRFGNTVHAQRFVMEEGSGQVVLVNAQSLADMKWKASDFTRATDEAK